jgi:hypothetical protein
LRSSLKFQTERKNVMDLFFVDSTALCSETINHRWEWKIILFGEVKCTVRARAAMTRFEPPTILIVSVIRCRLTTLTSIYVFSFFFPTHVIRTAWKPPVFTGYRRFSAVIHRYFVRSGFRWYLLPPRNSFILAVVFNHIY